MTFLSYIVSLAALVCAVAVLIKLFQKEGALKGILGIICLLYTYIWGWMHFKDESLKIKNWMYVWTGVIVLSIIINVIIQMQAQVQAEIFDQLNP